MPARRFVALTGLAMVAFAGNSLFTRVALRDTRIDAALFTSLRLGSGAVVLAILLSLRRRPRRLGGSWPSALALFAYAVAISFAYVRLPAGIGALLLFGAVQLEMIGFGLRRGERLTRRALLGLLTAVVGLVVLLLPGADAPPVGPAVLMLSSGLAWGAYSLLGRGETDPLAATAGNFVRALPLAAVLVVAAVATLEWDGLGVLYAVLCGGLTSGIGYAIWYAAQPGLRALQASVVQLSVPVLTALAGTVLLSEELTVRLVLTSSAVLGGVALCLSARARST